MRVVVVTDDVIFPSNSGGRQELLGECLGLMSAGCIVSLVVSHRLELSDQAEVDHKALTPEVFFTRRRGFLGSFLRHPFKPYQISSRVFARRPLEHFLAGDPIAGVIASHEWTIPLAKEIARSLGVPLILRSHNDELAYMKALASNATGLRRLYFALEKWRLRPMLKRLYGSVNSVAILSESDRAVYESYGVETYYVPPVLSSASSYTTDHGSGMPSPNSLLFVGALDMPQTAAGIRWFCEKVFPLIRTALPEAELHIAGRRAPNRLAQYLLSVPGVIYHGEVKDLGPLYNKAAIFINPVFEGSGVNMKVGPPAERGIPIVTTTIGARGLDKLLGGLEVADEPDSFSSSCVRLLTDNRLWLEKSVSARNCIREYSASAVGMMLLDLLCKARRSRIRG